MSIRSGGVGRLGTMPFLICGQRPLLLRVAADQPGTFQVAIDTP